MSNTLNLVGAQDPNSLLYYAVSVVLVILVLVGLNMLSRVQTAVRGNLLGALAMALAIVATLWNFGILSAVELYAAMLVGALFGMIIWRKTQMIRMPQTVALLNGLGGMASMLAGALALTGHADNNAFAQFTAGLAVAVGGATFFGSLIAAGKLHQILDQHPKVLPAHSVWVGLSLVVSLGAAFTYVLPPFTSPGVAQTVLLIVQIVAANLFGYLLAVRVGGADMPITISLLNSLSGLAGAIAGLAISDLLLVSIGAIVGASGLLLTQIMCRAMNRHLMDILLGKTSVSTAAPAPMSTETEAEKPGEAADESETNISETVPVSESVPVGSAVNPESAFADWVENAQRVILVPGYGMALSQAQAQVKRLLDYLEKAGKNVDFAIHPVAGRMPGHMNVLLAEVDVDYEKLREMQDINDDFATADLTVVVGANDVMNPAANTAEGTPIYGMPVLNVGDCTHVAIFNFDLKPGYAGVENPLYARAETQPDRVLIFQGDAKETLAARLDAMGAPPAIEMF